jgi:hypothetical protein
VYHVWPNVTATTTANIIIQQERGLELRRKQFCRCLVSGFFG